MILSRFNYCDYWISNIMNNSAIAGGAASAMRRRRAEAARKHPVPTRQVKPIDDDDVYSDGESNIVPVYQPRKYDSNPCCVLL